jgi:predicted nucleotidyltransferase
MTSGPSDRVLEVARAVSAELVAAGAKAVYMTGSHARGDAHHESDIDIRAIGDGSSPHLKRHDEFLISTSWLTYEESESMFQKPEAVGEVVPGWRDALVLHDPDGVAAALKKRAEEWDWSEITEAADEWIAEQITEYAEEVHTLIGNIDQGQLSGAAAIRSQLALHLAQVLAVHKRILYGSENVLWAEVAQTMGDEYRRNQELALALEPTSLEESCRAALSLFEIAVAETAHLLDDVQRSVVTHATDLAAERAS